MLTTNLVFLQEFELDGDITAQSFIFVSVDLVLLLSHLNAYHCSCIPRAQTHLLQIRAVGIKLKSATQKQYRLSQTLILHAITGLEFIFFFQLNYKTVCWGWGLLPCIFILLDSHQSIFHCFVDQGVDTGHKEVDGTQQSLAILTEQFLCFCIITKFILQRNTNVLHTAGIFMSNHPAGSFGRIVPVTLGTSG